MSAIAITVSDLDCDATCDRIRISIINGDTYAAIDAVRRLRSNFDRSVLEPRFTKVSAEVDAVADEHKANGNSLTASAIRDRLHTVLGGLRTA